MGGGEANNVKFAAGEKTEFTFPFALRYRSSDDPGNAVFVDLGQKCGIDGRPKSDIKVDYKLTVRNLSVLVKRLDPDLQWK